MEQFKSMANVAGKRIQCSTYLILLWIVVAGLYKQSWNNFILVSMDNSHTRRFDLDQPVSSRFKPPFSTPPNDAERFRCTMSNGTLLDTRVFPHFIIAGTQKGGTSAISRLLQFVPDLRRSTSFEPHFWSRELSRRDEWTRESKCDAIAGYLAHFKRATFAPGTLVYEKTPLLLALPWVPQMIRGVLEPHIPKIVVILRDPVDRFYSEYKMTAQRQHGKNMTVPSLESLINREIVGFHQKGILRDFPLLTNTTFSDAPSSPHRNSTEISGLAKYQSTLARGFYANQLKHYLPYFSLGTHLKVVHYENFTKHKVETLNDILDFVGAPRIEWPKRYLDRNLGPYGRRSSENRFEPELLGTETRAYLKAMYRPFNNELASILGDAWQNVWNDDELGGEPSILGRG
jgi:Sulfotransferase domain